MMDKIKRLAKQNKFFYFIVCVGFWLNARLVELRFMLNWRHPIQKNKIVCANTKGKNYGDNPKYIIDELMKKSPGKYDIVWLLNKDFDGELPEGIRRVDYGSKQMIYELATSSVWIDSNTKDYGTLKRKGQYYIQTWHGSYGIKKLCFDMDEHISFFDRKNINWNSMIEDLFTSNSKAYSTIYRRALNYKNDIVEWGSPRNDIFFHNGDAFREKIENYYDIKGKKIVLYAPTYRDDFNTEFVKMNFERLTKSLENRFGGEWVVMVRLHPQNMKDSKALLSNNDRIINATDYSIMQELLVAADVLITDYSSCMFDFVTKGKPCFIYATDIEKYHNDRGFYYDIYDLAFDVAANDEQLAKHIEAFDESRYSERLQKMYELVGLNETGEASKKIADLIEDKINEI